MEAMKKISFVFCFVFLFFGYSFAFDLSSYCDITRYSDEALYFNGGSLTCDQVTFPMAFGSSRMAAVNTILTGHNYISNHFNVDSGSLAPCNPSDKPNSMLFVICADIVPSLQDANDVESNYTDSACQSATVTGVSLGGEKTAASAACASLMPGISTANPKTGYLRTDNQNSVAYVGELDSSGITSTLHVVCCKLGGYTSSDGNPVPIGSLPNSGSVLVDPTDNGVSSKGSPKGTSIDPLKVSNGGPLGTSGDPLNVSVTNPSGGGLSSSDLNAQLADARTYSAGAKGSQSGWDTLGSSFGSAADNILVAKNGFDSFVNTMKTTSLFSAHGSFFSAGSAALGGSSAGVVTVNGGNTFGSHDFDFAQYAPALLIIRSIMLIIFAFLSIKVVVLKGGGG